MRKKKHASPLRQSRGQGTQSAITPENEAEKKRGGPPSEVSREAASGRNLVEDPGALSRASLRQEAQGHPSVGGIRVIGRAGIQPASAIPGSREPGKRRGAQPRNQNARKHGFYSRHFKHREQQLLETLDPADISAEIELIRVTCARFLSAWKGSSGTSDYEASLTALRAVNLSAQTIAMLLRAQSITGAPREELAEFLKSMQETDPAPGTEDPSPFGQAPNEPAPA